MKKSFARRLLPLVAALVLAGCASPPARAPEAAEVPAAFKEAGERWINVQPADTQSRGSWWLAFGDPVLDDLVARAEASNTSLQAAAARVAQARALVRDARSRLLPTLGVSASAVRGTVQPGLGAPPGAVANLGSAGFAASWEPDVFGKASRTRDAAQLDARSRIALQQDTKLLVDAEVAQAYFGLRALDAERALVRETVSAYRDTLHLTERRFQAGDLAELDVVRVRAEVAATTAQALALDRDRALHEHALAVLLGAPASGYTLAERDWQATSLPIVPAGLPATVLMRRPDVAAAQLAMQAAEARAGVARRAWFPDIALTAQAGYASTDLGHLFDWSARAWGVGALLSLPLFDGGRREAGVQLADARWDEAAADYREHVLVAFRDVEDSLASLRLLGDQAEAQDSAIEAAARATALSDARYRNGLVSQLELLDARRSELADRRAAVQVRAARYDATVGLVRALGGGWGAAPAGDASERQASPGLASTVPVVPGA